MTHISAQDAKAWFKGTEVSWNLSTDPDAQAHESQIASQVLSRVAQAFDVTSWVDSETTPLLVRSAIAMQLVAWWYDRAYSTTDDVNPYSANLRAMSERIVLGILNGTMELLDADQPSTQSGLSASIAGELLITEPVFTMGKVF
jgi:hypothetical protein